MPAATHPLPSPPLSLEDFRTRYSHAKPYFEFWFGEAVQKSITTTVHGILQFLLMLFLDRAGYYTASETELRIDPEWQPKPDVIADPDPLETPYPSKPVQVVAEVLSPEDSMTRVYAKCRHYDRIGISVIFVLDPESGTAWHWSRETGNLERVPDLFLPSGAQIRLDDLWTELGRRSRAGHQA